MSGYYHKCQMLMNGEIMMICHYNELFFFISEVGIQPKWCEYVWGSKMTFEEQ
jgi:hypothetical protein